MKLHQGKATIHTLKSTIAFLETIKIDTSIECMAFQYIPTMYPDVSPIEYCAFYLLKRVFFKHKPTTIDGLWKIIEENGNQYFWKFYGKLYFQHKELHRSPKIFALAFLPY